MTSINDLPSEILLHILKFLPGDSMLNCRLISKNYNRIITTNRKSLAKQKLLSLEIRFHCLTEGKNRPYTFLSPLVVTEEHLDNERMSIAFQTGERTPSKKETYCKKGDWMDHRKSVFTKDLPATFNEYLYNRLAINEYRELTIRGVPSAYQIVIPDILRKHKVEFEQIYLDTRFDNMEEFEELMTTDTIRKASTLRLHLQFYKYWMSDEIFQTLSFTGMGDLNSSKGHVPLSYSQLAWILKEWRNNRRPLEYITAYNKQESFESFEPFVAEVGFENSEHRNFKFLRRGDYMIILKWFKIIDVVYMNFVVTEEGPEAEKAILDNSISLGLAQWNGHIYGHYAAESSDSDSDEQEDEDDDDSDSDYE